MGGKLGVNAESDLVVNLVKIGKNVVNNLILTQIDLF